MHDGYDISCGITIETAFIQKKGGKQFWLNFKTQSWPCLFILDRAQSNFQNWTRSVLIVMRRTFTTLVGNTNSNRLNLDIVFFIFNTDKRQNFLDIP
jgi:hypothetical protein